MIDSKIRVRFAPSPTGPLHIGGVRTALFNFLFAKKNNGKFILRIEDTDQQRYVPGAEEYIQQSLGWCGIEFDEGVSVGGPYSPYRQSERKSIYKEYAEKLVETKNAYYAFDSSVELEEMHKRLTTEKVLNTSYCEATRLSMCNSFTLSDAEVKRRIDNGEHYVIRFKMHGNEVVSFDDSIRGHVEVNSQTLDDKVLFKSDGMPTYHLANVVDDYLMKISHVIRGEEWLPSTPLHVLLYRAFGWENQMPEFVHLPLLLKPDGKGKLSKRDGDKLGFPVFPLQWKDPNSGEISSGYRESGYFPEAFINMLALLGWNPGTQQEIFSLNEMIEDFSLERVVKSGARFDHDKTRWFNQQYLRKKSDNELAHLLIPILENEGIYSESEYITAVCRLMKERITFIADILKDGKFFFHAPESYDKQMVAKRWNDSSASLLNDLKNEFENAISFTSNDIENICKSICEKNNIGLGVLMNIFRLVIVGSSSGPGMTEIASLLGKNEVITRIRIGIERIQNTVI